MQSYKDLVVWQESVKLVKEVYLATQQFPKHELFTLTNQVHRAVISIPSNIAEGHMRRGSKEFLHFSQIAFGSAAELDTQLIIAKDLGYLNSETSEKLV